MSNEIAILYSAKNYKIITITDVIKAQSSANYIIFKRETTMPTIHLEYTDNLKITNELKPFLQAVHYLLVEMIKTDLPTCRSLIKPYSDYVVGSGANENAFIQMTIKMLPGRSDELKHSLGNTLLEKIQSTFTSEINRLNTEIRVYIEDTDINHYYGLLQR